MIIYSQYIDSYILSIGRYHSVAIGSVRLNNHHIGPRLFGGCVWALSVPEDPKWRSRPVHMLGETREAEVGRWHLHDRRVRNS
jgi:hypothetical protein